VARSGCRSRCAAAAQETSMKKHRVGITIAVFLSVWLVFAYREAHSIEVTRQEVLLPRLPPEFDGFRIVLLADLHLNGSRSYTENIGRLVEGESGDALVIAGDIRDFFAGEATASAEFTRLLPAFGKFASIFAVNGNVDTVQMMQEVEAAGVRVLRNEREILTRGASTLGFAGVTYPYAASGVVRSLQRFQTPEGGPLPACQILIAHSPDVMLFDESRAADLVLSGHTHGGQIAIPMVGALVTGTRLGRRYASGLFPFDDTWLFVSRGLGTTFVPLRFFAPPEIVVLTLRKG
jgi:predicted MPP superfamily phosphohydrolase